MSRKHPVIPASKRPMLEHDKTWCGDGGGAGHSCGLSAPHKCDHKCMCCGEEWKK